MIEELYKIFQHHPVISTDTRKISKNSIFFALKGSNFNGDDFATEALNSGASYAVVSKNLEIDNDKFFKVDDVLVTLQKLASYHRKKIGIKILAITGSNGKTTTKELCKAVLGKKFNVLATSGNLNNHIGVPLTLLSINDEINFGIIEMGANHPGEIKLLCKIAEPDFGLITNVGKAHLEGFGSIEGVAKAKGEMFDFLMNKGGTIFMNNANEYVKSIVPDNYKKVVHYNNEGYYGKVISSSDYLISRINLNDSAITVNTKMIGKYNIENIVAAAAIGDFFKVSHDDIKDAIENYNPDNNRSQLVNTGKNKVILDAYNANPSSMINAIENFIDIKEIEKIVILGQMLELGTSSATEHEKIADYLKNKNLKTVILLGKEFRMAAEKNSFTYFENVHLLIESLNKNPLKSSTILVKGSRGNQLEKIIPFL